MKKYGGRNHFTRHFFLFKVTFCSLNKCLFSCSRQAIFESSSRGFGEGRGQMTPSPTHLLTARRHLFLLIPARNHMLLEHTLCACLVKGNSNRRAYENNINGKNEYKTSGNSLGLQVYKGIQARKIRWGCIRMKRSLT